MLFGSLSTTNSTPVVLNPVLAARPSSTVSAPAGAPASGGRSDAAQPTTAPATISAPARPAARGGAHGGDGGAAAAATGTLLETAIAYSTTVGGKQYSGSVLESDGEYTASVPDVPGATASGSTEQAAENNLNARIDELV
jgi:hypothetical protein